MRKLMLATVAMLTLTAPALALNGTLTPREGGKTVFVWKSVKAHDEALSLIDADVHRTNPVMLLPLISCIVPSGTPAITTSAGFATHDILVTGGEKSGCRGNVAVEDFKSER